MTERGALKVDQSFRVEGFQNIFAMGDCTSYDEPKLGVYAIEHGETMAKIIRALDRGKNLPVYRPGIFFALR